MYSSLRAIVFAAVAFGPFSLAAFIAGSLTTVWPSAPALAYPSCPASEEQRKQACEALNSGNKKFDFYVPMSLNTDAPLVVCVCGDTTVQFCDEKTGACPALSGPNAGADVYLGNTVEGSHCKELCKSSTGGTGTVYYQCVQICNLLH